MALRHQSTFTLEELRRLGVRDLHADDFVKVKLTSPADLTAAATDVPNAGGGLGDARDGASVTTVGYYRPCDTPTPTFGEYVGPHHDEHGNWLKFQGLVMPGHSGGPVVDERGVVVAWNVRNLASPCSTSSYQTYAGLNELRSIAEGFAVIDAAEARLVNDNRAATP